MERPPLPDFEKPPLVEVALSMQFEKLANFRAVHLGLLWQSLGRDRFPNFEEQPPVQETIERFGPVKATEFPKFELMDVPPVPRYLFVSADGTEVVQIQQDRFTVNWRKRNLTDVYPRFEALAAFFQTQVATFERFVTQNHLGQIKATQAEVTYVNRIEPALESRKLGMILSVFSGVFTDNFLQEPEEAYSSFRFPMMTESGRVGSLYVEVRPEIPGEKNGTLKMVLLARGRPQAPTSASASDFFMLARKYIVSGFASITSKEAHATWGRIDNACVS